MAPVFRKTVLDSQHPLRKLFLEERNMQFVHNKCHDYGWSDDYLIEAGGREIGYGSVWGSELRKDRDTVFEFYLLPAYREQARVLFRQLLAVSGVTRIESQSNDRLMVQMLYVFGENIEAEAVLFEDGFLTGLPASGRHFRPRRKGDDTGDDDSDFVLEHEGTILGTGGLMLNYNFPYADIYMQVGEPFRRTGAGAYLVQELKAHAYSIGRVPAARCNIRNIASFSTLHRAGMQVCGYLLKGAVPLQERLSAAGKA